MPPRWSREPSILLCPNTPQPLHGVAPRVVLGQSWWNKERKAAYASTGHHCKACGVHKSKAKSRQWMEGHELYDIDYMRGRMTYVRTVPLCHYCHNFIHDGRLEVLLEKGLLHHSKYVAIMNHGSSVLEMAGLVKPSKKERDLIVYNEIVAGRVAEWGTWRLIINGAEYPPIHKTIQEYNAYWDSN